MTNKTIAFIGLGTMGFPMAGHLATAGFHVVVYNRTTATAERWLNTYPGKLALTPAEAAQEADVVLTCVGNDNDVREVYCGEQGILSTIRPGTLLIDHTTASADVAREIAEAASKASATFIDAPVSGGEAGAVNGCLTIMVGGSETAFQTAQPIFNTYAKASTLMGDVGFGQITKMANQICITGILQGLSEAITLAKAAGLDIEKMTDVLKHGAAGSWQMENRAVTMAEDKFDFGFAIDWMRKDLSICFEAADKLSVPLPLARQVDAEYAKLQDRGFNRADTSVLIKQFDQ
ncbi:MULTISPECIES: NAD(P)-dependent oxidoreductase [Photobacterium]|uniref:2-hydroxy-3-oxopropionate reductase n=1 Tax=Photobacterium halotolerans TaxID=265726 RepID=A0A0F5VAM2_9GAMM|nr:NAD(P)-dependent oxidoreductase [Photobacterium halotolerans]KKC99132.1 2-hydroxy-3-oxopropionate reductase [Photobacterium halotolerans]UIP30081.1 NAD(P)-dependent oxidoreductase [Photobacterium sp. TLY01]